MQDKFREKKPRESSVPSPVMLRFYTQFLLFIYLFVSMTGSRAETGGGQPPPDQPPDFSCPEGGCFPPFPSSCFQDQNTFSPSGLTLSPDLFPEETDPLPDGFSIHSTIRYAGHCIPAESLHFSYRAHSGREDPIQLYDASRGIAIPFTFRFDAEPGSGCRIRIHSEKPLLPSTRYRWILQNSLPERIEPAMAASLRDFFTGIRSCEKDEDYRGEARLYSLPDRDTVLFTDSFSTRSVAGLLSPAALVSRRIARGSPGKVLSYKKKSRKKDFASFHWVLEQEVPCEGSECKDFFAYRMHPPESERNRIRRSIAGEGPDPSGINRVILFSSTCRNRPDPEQIERWTRDGHTLIIYDENFCSECPGFSGESAGQATGEGGFRMVLDWSLSRDIPVLLHSAGRPSGNRFSIEGIVVNSCLPGSILLDEHLDRAILFTATTPGPGRDAPDGEFRESPGKGIGGNSSFLQEFSRNREWKIRSLLIESIRFEDYLQDLSGPYPKTLRLSDRGSIP